MSKIGVAGSTTRILHEREMILISSDESMGGQHGVGVMDDEVRRRSRYSWVAV